MRKRNQAAVAGASCLLAAAAAGGIRALKAEVSDVRCLSISTFDNGDRTYQVSATFIGKSLLPSMTEILFYDGERLLPTSPSTGLESRTRINLPLHDTAHEPSVNAVYIDALGNTAACSSFPIYIAKHSA